MWLLGFGDGYIDLVAYLPEDRISIAVLLNERYGGSSDALFRNAHDILAVLLSSVLNFDLLGIADESAAMPVDYTLKQNYPNPFNSNTTIQFALPRTIHVSIKVYNALGSEVVTLLDKYLPPGQYKTTWNAADFASGIYFYRIKAGEFQDVKKMVLLR